MEENCTCILETVNKGATANVFTNGTSVHLAKDSIPALHALLILFGTGLFSMILAYAHTLVRKYVYKDRHNLDLSFDAGGKVSIGLTATTFVSQMIWTGTTLLSTIVTIRFGISGTYWFATLPTVVGVLLALVALQLKTGAPGAKTFLQVIDARFGKAAHINYCLFALFVNIMVCILLLLGGTQVIVFLVDGVSIELTALILAAVIGSYTLIGGLGATFYVSYFNTVTFFLALIWMLIEMNYGNGDKSRIGLGTSEMYSLLSNATVPDGSGTDSFLAFYSQGGLMLAGIMLINSFTVLFMDQSYWQSSVAARPLHDTAGFILGSIVWFTIPLAFGTAIGLMYIALEAQSGEQILTPEEINKGFAAPVVAHIILGSPGVYVVFILMIMAIMSTGSAEVIAIASIIVYDIYQAHIYPFRKNKKKGVCMLCGKENIQNKNITNILRNETHDPAYIHSNLTLENHDLHTCTCKSLANCYECKMWRPQKEKKMKELNILVQPPYNCKMHGLYLKYQDELIHFKNWCILWVTIFLIPLIIFTDLFGVNLAWAFYFTQTVAGCIIFPLYLALYWTKLSMAGAIAGVAIGCPVAIAAWLAVTSTYEGGLNNFIANTSREIPTIVGGSVSLCVGAVAAVIVSLCTSRGKHQQKTAETEFGRLRNIDNPLYPWAERYGKDFGIKHSERPTDAMISTHFRKAKIVTATIFIVVTLALLFIIPGVLISFKTLSESEFKAWMLSTEVLAYIGGLLIIVFPLLQEIYDICAQLQRNQREEKENKKHIDTDDSK